MCRWLCLRKLGLVIYLTLWGCTEHKEAPTAPQFVEDTATVLFANPSTATGALCPDAVEAKLGVTIPVRVWARPEAKRGRLSRNTEALESSLLHLGIRFRAVGGVRSLAENVAFVEAGPEGVRALKQADTQQQHGPLDAAARSKVLAPFVAAPLRRMLARMTPESPAEVQVLFLEHIASRRSTIAAGLQRAAGLTLSPYAADSEDAQQVADLIGVPLSELKAPVILLSLYELARMPREASLTTLGHEMGHAFGLSHVGGRDNLMSLMRRGECRPGLDDEQIAVLQKNLARVLGQPRN